MRMNGQNVTLTAAVLALAALACASDPSGSKKTTANVRTASFPHVSVQKEKGNTTGVYQEDLIIYPALIVNGKQLVDGNHSFSFASTASYGGRAANCVEKNLAMTLSHDADDIKTWGFPPGTKATIVVDGSAIALKVYSQLPYALPSMAKYMKDPQPSEALIISPTCDMYRRLSKAKSVSFQIGDNAAFELEGDAIDNFREFASDIGYK